MIIQWNETSYNNFKCDIGNYIRLELLKNTKGVWSLYLSIRVFKEDGANYSKVCQHQKVATVSKIDDIILAKSNAEKWYKEFILDQVNGAVFSLTDLLS